MTRANPGRRSVLEVGGLLGIVLSFAMAAEASATLVDPFVAALAIGQNAQVQRKADGSSADADAPNEEDAGDSVFLPAERTTLQRLSKSRELLREKRYGEAVRYLGAILDGAEDYFFQPDKKAPIHRSLKAEAQRLIGQMPSEGRDLYELQYGARARQMLEEAVSTGDSNRLAEVSRRFFHTRGGYQATFLLGLNHFNHGRPLAGALNLQRLHEAMGESDEFEPTLSLTMATCWLQAGMADKSRAVLIALREQHPSIKIEVAGRNVAMFAKDADCIHWLLGLVGPQAESGPAETDRWLMFRGDPARNASAGGSAPLLNMRWRVTATDDPLVEDAIGQLRVFHQGMDRPILSGLHPLAVDDVVLMRTMRNLLAVDFVTGKRLWEVPVDEGTDWNAASPLGDAAARQAPVLASLCQRVLDDLTYGTMSSDGRYVFTIEDLETTAGSSMNPGGPGMAIGGRRVWIGNPRGNTAPGTAAPSNRLAAHDIRTGKLKWHIGGPADQFALRQPETFFLGPPLPLLEQLYVLAEVKGEIRLLALEASTGNLIWSQQLAVVEQSVQDIQRRSTGISPSYADGILVCPTSTGAIVAVELATRSLLWGYRYGRGAADPLGRNRNFRLGWQVDSVSSVPTQQPWADAGVCIAEGRILATPVESDSLHCLSLLDGELLWKHVRQNDSDLYVACVDEENVVLVGTRTVHALRLSDGKPAWGLQRLSLPDNSMPSGRGCLCGDRYYVPLSSAEVLGFDIRTGKQTHCSKSRKGDVPGNLISYKGRILSQGLDGLDAFYQIDAANADVAQRLAANPDDAEALALRGEILLDAGNREEAIACLRRSYRQKDEPRTRGLLREALFDGLRADFSKQRNDIVDLSPLLEDASQRGVYLRLMAGGMEQAGEWLDAFGEYQKLIDLVPDQRPLDPIDKSWAVRRDRWVRSQLADMIGKLDGDSAAKTKILGEIESRGKDALASKSHEDLRRFLDFFPTQPIRDTVQEEHLRRLKTAGQWLDAELTLWRMDPSRDPIGNPKTAAGVIDLVRQAGRTEDAALGYRWLCRQFPDEACCEGKTCRQWIESMPADQPLRQRLDRDEAWPVGNVKIEKKDTKNANTSGFGRYAMELRGNPGPFLSDASLQFDQSGRAVVAYDGLGRQRWAVPLVEEGSPQLLPSNHNLTFAQAYGHLLFVAVGSRVFAIDTTTSDENVANRLLWSHDLSNPGGEALSIRQIAAIPWQLQQAQFMTQQHVSHTNTLGPVTSRYVCFQRFRSVQAVDPRTGETLWIRHDIPQDSELFGDDDYTLALPPEQPEALLFRATDGKPLGTRKIPRPKGSQTFLLGVEPMSYPSLEETGFAVCGRMLLLRQPKGPTHTLTLFDPVEGKNLWTRDCGAGAHAAALGSAAVGVMERDGHFVLLAMLDGRPIVDAQLEPERSLADIFLFSSAGQYFLLTNSMSGHPANGLPAPQAMPGCSAKPIDKGRLYAFDRQGALLWPKPTGEKDTMWSSRVAIADQYFLLNQHERLPVLVFAVQKYDQALNAQGKYEIKLLCIDKRTGRTVFKDKFIGPTGVFNISGDPEKRTVTINMARNTIALTFTDQPIPPPEPPAKKQTGDRKGENTTVPKALWKSLQRAIGGGADEASTDEEEETPANP